MKTFDNWIDEEHPGCPYWRREMYREGWDACCRRIERPEWNLWPEGGGMSTRLSQLGQQLRETIPSDDINAWGKAMVIIGMIYDEAVRMETAAYERGMKEGRDEGQVRGEKS